MKNTKRNQPRRTARTSREVARLRERLEMKLLRICADIGWICGWRKERSERAPTVRRSSRERVMLGRVLSADARAQEPEASCPREVVFVSSGRTAYSQSESVAETNGFVGLAIDLQDELMSLGRFGISAGQLAVVLGDNKVRSIGRQLWEQRRSLL